MRGLKLRRMAAAALLVLGLVGLTAQAEEPFDLVFDLKLTSELTSLLKPGDTLQFVLQPQVQFGQRSTPGSAISIEKVWSEGMTLAPITFKNAVGADQIYRLELKVSRRTADGTVTETRYLSALDKTQRRPVDKAIPLRLQIADPDDARDNNVYLVRDSDGIYRVMMFFA